ncbi:hypothetical protein Cgig2_020201 [Carnegiea gigantea]|uniref:C2H2-type domain-containing protein n=1 Tax=Carnegiea gigantea TaxID=171969 RepID=A0A9Q1KX78_9CARY|nr:hypothetical protein Cgig2_020201 [Carnegiea gigantea]
MEVPPNNSDDENNPNKKLGNFKIKLKIPKQHHQNPAQIQDEDELEEGEIREDQDQHQEEGEIAPADNSNTNNGVIKREISSPNQDQGVITVQAAGLRACPVCGKGFGSGKALGGHMRVHAEPSPNHLKRLKSVPGRVGPSRGQGPAHQQLAFKCDICPKEFPSQKSLFGHMRSHPERHWRGMNPPPDLTGSGPSSPSPGPDMCPDPDPSYRKIKIDWTMRRKKKLKGRSCSSSSSSEGGGQQVDAEVAATDLMLILAGGERNSRVKEKGKGKKIKGTANNLEYDSDEVYYLKNMGYLDSDDCDTEEDEEVVQEKAAVVVELEGDDKLMIGENRSGKRRRMMKGKKIRVLSSNKKLDDPIQGEVPTSSGKNINFNNAKNSDGKWRCNTCSKTFPTHQALGGHRSSHNKEKNLGIQINHHIHTHIHIHTRAHVNTINGSGSTSPGLVGGDKTIPSDQSEDLEGQHYAPPCEASSSSPGQSSCQTGQRDNAIEFDLNEAPSTMVEEEVEDQ